MTISDADMSAQLAALAVGSFAIPFLFAEPSGRKRWAAITWVCVWCGPPLIRLWFTAVLA